MAEDAVDRAVQESALPAAPCRTRRLPLLGAASPAELAAVEAPPRLLRRFGAEAPAVLAEAVARHRPRQAELLAPLAPGIPATLAELVFGITHEGARTVEDLLDRRTRIGLVPADRELRRAGAAERALGLCALSSRPLLARVAELPRSHGAGRPRRPERMAPAMPGASRWSPATKTPSPRSTSRPRISGRPHRRPGVGVGVAADQAPRRGVGAEDLAELRAHLGLGLGTRVLPGTRRPSRPPRGAGPAGA